jgi:hypothetical protein
MVANPRIERWIHDNESPQNQQTFVDIAKDEMFFAAHGYIYFYLNLFEEVVATAYGDRITETHIQFGSWRTYILKTMSRPLFLEVFKGEDSMCWMNLQRFLDDHNAKSKSNGVRIPANVDA